MCFCTRSVLIESKKTNRKPYQASEFSIIEKKSDFYFIGLFSFMYSFVKCFMYLSPGKGWSFNAYIIVSTT